MRNIFVFSIVFGIALSGTLGCKGCKKGSGNEAAEKLGVVIETCDNGEDDNGDGLTDCEDPRCQLTEACTFEPPDPADVAPPLDPSTIGNFTDGVRFLWEGDNPVIRGVDPDVLDESRVSVIRAKVLDRDGNPVQGIRATVAGQPGLGYTYSRRDGAIDLVANGGTTATIRTKAQGFLAVDRTVDAPMLDYKPVEDVVLTVPDDKVSNIKNGGIATASTVEDEDGARTARFWFPKGTVATAHLPDGQTGEIRDFDVRLTEYTVGEQGPAAMPAFLPENSEYTYAVEMSIDEAEAVGAEEVTFDKTAYLYLDNFLDFEVGDPVPSGYYSRTRMQWEPTEDGRVVQLVDGGLDVDGSGEPASRQARQELGITNPELNALEKMFEPGDVFWRTPITHFSPQDLNWPWEWPEDAIPPEDIPELPGDDDDPCAEEGSVIECQNQVLMKSLPIAGSEHQLVYRSDRTEGRMKGFELYLTDDMVPESLKRVEVRIEVAGRSFEETFEPAPDLTYTFEWDRVDGYGRELPVSVPVEIAIGYTYDVVFTQPAGNGSSFNSTGGGVARPARVERTWWRRMRDRVGSVDARTILNMGGWALSHQHVYAGDHQIFYNASGPELGRSDVSRIIRNYVGFHNEDLPVEFEQGFFVPDVLVGSDDSLYLRVAQPIGANLLMKLLPDGTLEFMAGRTLPEEEIFTSGCLTNGNCGQGGPLDQAVLIGQHWAIGPDDTIYVADHQCVRRIRDGSFEDIAGTNCASGTSDDDFPGISDLAVGPDGSIYVGDGDRIVKLDEASGEFRTVAGCDDCSEEFDGGPATSDVELNLRELAVGQDGVLRYFDSNGRLVEVAGSRLRVVYDSGDQTVRGLSRGRDGALYFFENADASFSYLLKRFEAGSVQTIAGTPQSIFDPEQSYLFERAVQANNIPASSAFLLPNSNPAVTSQGAVYFSTYLTEDEADSDLVLKEISHAFGESVGDGQAFIAASHARHGYLFDERGRLEEIRSTLGDLLLYDFTHESDGLRSFRDRDGLETTVERDAEGKLQAIVGPHGRRTEVTLDGEGYIRSVTYPDGATVEMTYDDGLMTTWRDAVGNATTYTYDISGNLTRVDDAEGGWKTLTRERSGVTLETSSGRTIRYGAGGEDEFWVETTSLVDQAGLEWNSRTEFGGQKTLEAPDGTLRATTLEADPRFGVQAPYVARRTTRTPSGLEQTSFREKSVTLSNPRDIESVESMVETIDINGAVTTYTWDAVNRTMTRVSAEGRQETFRFDENHRNIEVDNGVFEPLRVRFDDEGNPVEHSIGSDATNATFQDGQLASFTSATGNETVYDYDQFGRVTRVMTAEGRIYEFGYDSNGNPTETSVGGSSYQEAYNSYGLRTRFTYPSMDSDLASWNVDRALESVTLANGDGVQVARDETGRVSGWQTERGDVVREYDADTGQVARSQSPDGVVEFTYDGFLRTGRTVSFEGQSHDVTVDHDDNFRVARRSAGGVSVDWQYDLDGLPTRAGAATIRLHPDIALEIGFDLGSLSTDYEYDASGRRSRATHTHRGTTVFEQTYAYDPSQQLVTMEETSGGVTSTIEYGYDRDGNLTTVTRDGTLVEEFTYDDRGNRTGLPYGAATYDASDRVQQVGGRTYQVDAAGFVTGWTDGGQNVSLEYDGNMLVGADVDGTIIEYGYDSRERRIWRKVNGMFDRGWVYGEDERPLAEVDANGDVVSRFVYVTKSFSPDFMIRGGQTYRILQDRTGTVRRVVDTSSGDVVQQLDYDALGRVTNDTNDGFQPFTFAGGLYDAQTGLVRLGVRDYDPVAGRWTAVEPLRFGADGYNLYAYVSNDPINRVDPNGRAGFLVPVLKVAVVVALGGAGAVTHAAYHWKKHEQRSNRQAQEIASRLGLSRIDAENAMRHCIGQCEYSRATTTGYAEAVGDYHENPSIPKKVGGGGSQNAPGGALYHDRMKDEHNNICGRENANREGDCHDLCGDDLRAGRLATDMSEGTMMSQERNYTPDPIMTLQ